MQVVSVISVHILLIHEMSSSESMELKWVYLNFCTLHIPHGPQTNFPHGFLDFTPATSNCSLYEHNCSLYEHVCHYHNLHFALP